MKETLGKLAGYCVTAGIAAVVDLTGFVVLFGIGLPTVVAAVLSFALALGCNFILTSVFVFSRNLSSGDFGKFALGAFMGLMVNVSATTACISVIALHPALAKLAGIGAAFGFNFWVNYVFVFGERVRS
jgi:putative flippase GtrA